MLTLSISKLHFPGNQPIDNPITVSLYIKDYYGGTYTLIDDNVPVAVDGTITASPLPSVSIDPTEKYMLKAVNELCSFEYEQAVAIYPYCPINYTLSDNSSFCYIEETAEATPPSAPENCVAVSYEYWGTCGAVIYDSFNVNGTGSYTPISPSNPFWINGGVGTCATFQTLTDGVLNRTGVWAPVPLPSQKIGFSVCINITETKTYYIGVGSDNFAIIRVDGQTIISQDEAAMDAQFGLVGGGACSQYWNIYPIEIQAGNHAIELIGENSPQVVSNPASIGAEIYDNTPAEIAAATSYGDLNLIFSTKDYVGMPIQLGTDDVGYTCPVGFSLVYCESPVICRKVTTIPVSY